MTWIVTAVALMLGGLALIIARRLGTTRDRLARTEARLASVLEGVSAGLSVWDGDGRLTACNARFREFYPDVPLKAGVVYEDLIRYTANRGLVRLADDRDEAIDAWVEERVGRFGTPGHEVLRTAAGRWLDVHTRPTDAGEVLMLYADTTELRRDAAGGSAEHERPEPEAAEQQVLLDVVERVRGSASPVARLTASLEALCAWGGFVVAHAYWVGDDGRSLVPLPVWYAADRTDDRYAELKALSAEPRTPGDGIPGRAVRSGKVVWVPNVAVDPTVDDAQRSAMPGIHGACAVPIDDGDRRRAVLVFYASHQLTPDRGMGHVLAAAGAMLLWDVMRLSQQTDTGQTS